MSFGEASKVMNGYLKLFESLRSDAMKNVNVRRLAAYHVLGDSAARFSLALKYLAEIENHAEGDVSKLCGSWNYTRSGEVVSVSRVNPVAAVSYNREGKAVSFSTQDLSATFAPGELVLKFRGRELRIPLTLKGVEENAEVIKALGSRLLSLADGIEGRLEFCGKVMYGVRQ